MLFSVSVALVAPAIAAPLNFHCQVGLAALVDAVSVTLLPTVAVKFDGLPAIDGGERLLLPPPQRFDSARPCVSKVRLAVPNVGEIVVTVAVKSAAVIEA